MGVEAVTPMYSQTFFAYVTSGPDRPSDREYNEKIVQALAQGQRTKIFEEYRSLQQKFGRPSALHAWGGSRYPHVQSDILRIRNLGAGPAKRSRIQRKNRSSARARAAHENL